MLSSSVLTGHARIKRARIKRARIKRAEQLTQTRIIPQIYTHAAVDATSSKRRGREGKQTVICVYVHNKVYADEIYSGVANGKIPTKKLYTYRIQKIQNNYLRNRSVNKCRKFNFTQRF